ncbi:uncharacterized protein LOC125679066 isoform X2 [Ostrea edulis]|nr:uncharacterized protein LOC125679066 isoform X2 [Ostrea edulis]
MSKNVLTDSKPTRRKNKTKLKLSWDTPTNEERIAHQIDQFIGEVIESAKQEYLEQERPNSLNGHCGIYLNHDLKEEMIELTTREITDSHEDIDDYNINDNQTYQRHSSDDNRYQGDHGPARTNRAAELDEGNPLLAGNAHMPKRRYLRLLQRHILRMCCQCACLVNSNDFT